MIDLSRTLQDLEGHDWGEPTYDSHLVTECHRLRRVPLADFTIEDLRIMIGQNIGPRYLVPLALERLEENPWVSGDCYSGDLLMAVLGLPYEFWESHPDLMRDLTGIIRILENQERMKAREIMPAWLAIFGGTAPS